MRYSRPSIPALVTALLLIMGIAIAAGGYRGVIEWIDGDVRLRRAGTTDWARVVGAGRPSLYGGDHLQTMRGASAIIELDGARLRVGPSTHIVIPGGEEQQKKSGFWLFIGRVFVWLVGGRQLELGTQAAVAAAEGTRFVAEADASGTVTITVLEGQVALYNDLGRVTVRAGEQSSAGPGMAPTRPMQVDPSGFFEWEASLETVAPEWESRSFPGATRDELEGMLDDAQAAVEADPADAAAQTRLAAVLLDLGDPITAAAAARDAVESGDAPPEAQLFLGRALLRQSRAGEAILAFQAAAESPDLASAAWVGIAAAHVAARSYDSAAEALAQAGAADPANASVDAMAGLIALKQGDLDEAAELFESAASTDPGAWQAHAYLADLNLMQGDGAAARSHALQALQAAPASPLARRVAATVHFFTGDVAGAQEQVELALGWDETNARAHLLQSHLLVNEGDIDAALREAQMAVALEPDYAPAHAALGMIMLADGAVKGAEKAFTRALELDPRLVSAQTGMGMTWAEQGRMARAVEQNKAAIALDGDAASAWNNLGATHLALGDLDQAIAEFERALELQPEWAIPHANIAIAHLEANRFALALEHAERARELGGESARVLTTLARVYIDQGRINRAQVALRRALELDEGYALAHLQMAEVYVAQGRPRDAIAHQLRGITQQPSAIVDTREYSRTEATLAGGSLRAEIKKDGRGNDGQHSYLLRGAYVDDQERAQADWTQTSALAFGGRQTARERTGAGYVSVQREERDRPGAVVGGGGVEDPNYESEFTGLDLKYLARLPASDACDLTLKAGYLSSRVEDTNPDAFVVDRKVFRRLEVRRSGPTVEARLDRPLGRDGDLVAGVALAGEEQRTEGTMGTTPPGGEPGAVAWRFFEDVESRDAATFYGWYTHRAGNRTEVTLGGRAATREGMEPVLRPEGWVRHDLSRDGTLVILTRPVLRDDVSELGPVNDWASRPWISPLDLTTGGYSQSWEAVYELTPADGSVLRGAAFCRSLENLIVDLEDPGLSPGRAGLVVASGEVRGGEIEWERRLGENLSAGIWLRYTDTENDEAGGNELPFQPDWLGRLRLDYIDRSGTRVGVVWVHVGERFADVANTVELDGYDVLDLNARRQLNLHTDLFLTIENVLDESYTFWPGYPGRETRVRGGVEYRF